jgi:hypothetical protein
MVGSLIMAVTLMGQPPAPRPATARPAPAATAAAEKLIARRRAKKAATAADRYRSARAYEAQLAAEEEAARKEYKEMLPAMLENQRQMLQRQTDLERNQILNRLAGAAERSAGYVYPGQSPTMGPYR